MSPIRPAVFAGRFYPSRKDECLRMIEQMNRPVEVESFPVAGVVPHAGWIYSGSTAMLTYNALRAAAPQTVVVFGAVHTLDRNDASLYPDGSWETPLGAVEIDAALAAELATVDGVVADADAHRGEHSIEVQLPLMLVALGDVRIVPISVRPGPRSAVIGRACAERALRHRSDVVFVASTDLTHYGPNFAFEPAGHGPGGVRWAKEVNDRRFVQLIAEMNEQAIVPEAAVNHNACGSGAVAAAIAAAKVAGATRYIELEHTTSAERDPLGGGPPTMSVGYEAGVFVR